MKNLIFETVKIAALNSIDITVSLSIIALLIILVIKADKQASKQTII